MNIDSPELPLRWGAVAIIAVAAAACGRIGFDGPPGALDAASDGGLDGGADASLDGGMDGSDARLDAAPDADADADADMPGDAGVDADAGAACPADAWPSAWPHPEDVNVHFRSIAERVDPVVHAEGTATVEGGSTCVQVDTALPGDVGTGDRIRLSAGTAEEELAYILMRVDARHVVLQSPAARRHAGAYEIARAHPSMQSWADERGGDLVTENRRELGVCYADAVFGESVVIDGSTTDAEHYMHLTVAPGDRHAGLAGTGAVLEPVEAGHAIKALDDHTRVDWLEVRRWSVDVAGSYDGINVRASDVTIDHVIVHDDGAEAVDNPDCNGITVEIAGGSATIRNSLVYQIARSGIGIHNVAGAAIVVEGSTLYNCAVNDNTSGGYGCVSIFGASSGSITARNVISMGSGDGTDFAPGGDGFVDSHRNVSSDGSAPGAGSLVEQSPLDYFVDEMPGREDLHLRPGAPAVDVGADLSASMTDDMEGDARPLGEGWDIGADELIP